MAAVQCRDGRQETTSEQRRSDGRPPQQAANVMRSDIPYGA
jgi:hypothetical protein